MLSPFGVILKITPRPKAVQQSGWVMPPSVVVPYKLPLPSKTGGAGESSQPLVEIGEIDVAPARCPW